MNKLLYTIFCILLSFLIGHAQSIKFHSSSSLKTSFEKAKKKLLFVDTYASWCAPCKMMEQDVFPTKSVYTFYNKNFISVKIDMETALGEEFSNRYKVESIPTFYFFSGDGKLIFRKTGGTDNALEFVEYGQTALDIYALKSNNTEIQNPRSLLHYAYFLKEMADSSYNDFFHAYLATENDWSSPGIMQAIIDLAEKEGSPALEYFVENMIDFKKTLGDAIVSEKQLLIILDRSLEFLKNSPKKQIPNFEKLEPVFIKYFNEEEYKEHFLLFQFRYFQQNADFANMREVLRRFIKEIVEPMPDGREKAVEYINTAASFYEAAQGESKLQFEAIRWGEIAIALDQSADIYSILALLCEGANLTEKAALYRQKANEVKRKE